MSIKNQLDTANNEVSIFNDRDTVTLAQRALDVLKFWFGEIQDEMPVESRQKLWFSGGKKGDRVIQEQFESLLHTGAVGQLSQWEDSARGTLALIILLDQFPLHIYRKTARAFEFESRAIAVCRRGLQAGYDKQLTLSERSFFYLPLEHSESVADQDLSLTLFIQLHHDAAERHRSFTRKALKNAISHRKIIKQLGRYPYRNAVLGRVSSAEELSYLTNNGKRYGQ